MASPDRAEIFAGLMTLANGRLIADSRPGILEVHRSGPDACHLRWRGRDAPEEQLEVDVQGSFELVKIERPDGLVVRFKSQSPPQPDLFFWAQVPLAQIGPAVAGLERALARTPGTPGPSTARSDPEPASTSAAQSSRIGASALAAALSSLQQARRPAPGPSLLAVLQPERLLPLLARNPALVEAVAPHLPEQHRGAEAIAHLISTPQFRHTLQVLEHALNSGQVTAAHFGVQAEGLGAVALLEALMKEADAQRTGRMEGVDEERDESQAP